MHTIKVESAAIIDYVDIRQEPCGDHDTYVQIDMPQHIARLMIEDLQRQLDNCLTAENVVSVAAFGKKRNRQA